MSSIFLPPRQRSAIPSTQAPKSLRNKVETCLQEPTQLANQPDAAKAPDIVEWPSVIHPASAPDPLLRLPKVLKLTGCAESTWHRYVKLGLAPRGRRLGPNTVGWLLSDIQAWIQSRPQA